MTEPLNPNYNMDNLWDIISSDNSNAFGLQGYICPPLTLDLKKIKEDREGFLFMEKVWKGKALYPKRKEVLDKDGKPVPVKRPNFFEDVERSKNFGYSKEKEDQIREKYSSKNRSYDIDPEKVEIIKDKNKAKFYRYDRITYFDMLMKNSKKSFQQYPHMEQILEKVKEHIDKSPKRMMSSDEMKIKYSKKGSIS